MFRKILKKIEFFLLFPTTRSEKLLYRHACLMGDERYVHSTKWSMTSDSPYVRAFRQFYEIVTGVRDYLPPPTYGAGRLDLDEVCVSDWRGGGLCKNMWCYCITRVPSVVKNILLLLPYS
jgi:hypothetical protein